MALRPVGPRHGLSRRHKHSGASQGGGSRQKGGLRGSRSDREALGRSRGGFGSKVCVAVDGRGKAVSFTLTPGQTHELPSAMALLNALPHAPAMSFATVDTPRTSFEKLYGTEARARSSRRNATRLRSPAPNGPVGTDISSKTSGLVLRNGGQLLQDTRKPPLPSWPSSASQQPQIISRPNRP